MVCLVYLIGKPIMTVLMDQTLLWITLVSEMVFQTNSQFRSSLISSLFIYQSKIEQVSSMVNTSPLFKRVVKSISLPLSRIRRARLKYSLFKVLYFKFYLYYSSIMSDMLGQTKKGFLLPLLSKNNYFSFYKFKGFNSFRHVPKFVFFFIFVFYFGSFCLTSYFIFFYLGFFYYLAFLLIFYFIIPSSVDYLRLNLLLMMGEGVLKPDKPDFDRLFEMVCFSLTLSEE